MSEQDLKRLGTIQNILQDDWRKILASSALSWEVSGLEQLLDNRKLHAVRTESIKRRTSHLFSESEQARILNMKTRVGKRVYYQAFVDRQNSVREQLSELLHTRDALRAEKQSLEREIRNLESSVRSIEEEEKIN